MKKENLYKLVNKEDQTVDRIWKKYHDTSHIRYKMTRHRFNFIISNVIGPKVLDVGCGVGLSAHLLKDKEGIEEIHGVDLQEAAIRQAKIHAPHAKFHQAFGESLPLPDNYFDTVIISETLEHVYDVEKCILEAHRVLKNGGKLIVTIPYKGKTSELHIRSCNENNVVEPIKKYFNIEKQGIFNKSFYASPKLYCVAIKLS